MAFQYVKAFAPTVLTTSAATLYTVPTDNVLRSAVLRLSNTTAGLVTATVYAVPSGGTAADSNAVVKGLGIPANGFYDVAVPVMSEADFIQALASAGTSVTAHFLQGVLQA